MALHEWTVDDLNRWDTAVRAVAASFGLTPYPVDFRLYDYEQMLHVHAYHMPFRYSHWSFGKSYDIHRTMKRFELASLAYEMVVNTIPATAFCWRDNSLPIHVLVMAHVYGHSDFFANNGWFRTLTKAGGALEMFRSHADEIGRMKEDPSIPSERLEELLDAAHALMFHRSRVLGRKRETNAQQRERILKARNKGPGEWDHLKTREERKLPEIKLDRIPLEPDDDLLRFLAENSPLQHWERRVLEIVAAESDYFTPNIATKIMNEGWATFWHDRIFHALPNRPPEFDIEYARTMSGVAVPVPGSVNPYHLGRAIWDDIFRRWENPEGPDKKDWHLPGGQGFAKMFEVRDTEDDVSFVANYLTDELIARLHLFRYVIVDESDTGVMGQVVDVPDERGMERIRMTLAKQVGLNMFPHFQVANANIHSGRVLEIVHIHDGRDLALVRSVYSNAHHHDELSLEATAMMRHLQRIWRSPVVLLTKRRDKTLSLSIDFDGRFSFGN